MQGEDLVVASSCKQSTHHNTKRARLCVHIFGFGDSLWLAKQCGIYTGWSSEGRRICMWLPLSGIVACIGILQKPQLEGMVVLRGLARNRQFNTNDRKGKEKEKAVYHELEAKYGDIGQKFLGLGTFAPGKMQCSGIIQSLSRYGIGERFDIVCGTKTNKNF